MKRTKVQAFSLKQGPTESGAQIPRRTVGGEIAPVDKISVFLLQYGILIVLILVPLVLLLYKKRATVMRSIARLYTTVWSLTH